MKKRDMHYMSPEQIGAGHREHGSKFGTYVILTVVGVLLALVLTMCTGGMIP